MDISTALFAPETAIDPHPLFARLREAAPVHRLERYQWWAVTRHAEVARILKRPDLFSSDTGLDRLRPPHIDERAWQELDRMRGPSMFNSDPPEHTRLRKLVSAAFTPRAMTQLEARVQQITGRLIDAIVQRESFDVVEDLAIPLPVTVIAEMLGVDPARGADFKRWSDDLIALGRLTRERRGSAGESLRLVASRRELFAHMQAMIAARREAPRDDLISQLVRAESEEGALTAEEVLGMVLLLLVAGNETTTNLIATGTHLLLEHPAVLAELRADPGLVSSFIEEVLRYDGPATMLFRRTTAEVEVAGTRIAAGEVVVLLLSAANRDPAQFPEPDKFDIHRDTRGHLGFGQGIHFCVGAPLSRLEGRVAFTAMMRRLPAFTRVDARPAWNDNSSLRGLRSLPLRFARRAA
ncbi:Cytochrome P450 [Nannocystis exedens]|uniref:Cytochrome P450 n=1 Tax=Nannocystis exedens TaxID=54 RepID=A0A1I2HBT5_9BACT|nr:cytochrome P450 [Nannocystis exedens]PCC67848.1 cytochrome P450 hydroxylase [Nannocystis exedens]SFF27715.1 Cytochrome P450 [Nannocystis exedens]